jgi:hypothetical protein
MRINNPVLLPYNFDFPITLDFSFSSPRVLPESFVTVFFLFGDQYYCTQKNNPADFRFILSRGAVNWVVLLVTGNNLLNHLKFKY